ncbi:general stress protein [Psychrobacillus sp. INOP01]|uniref:general stress protein n=1 Tax=Psychrobacillus sp. INOP01 TaxID=2829187 RepID=UPI001BAA0170|nr:general stress protein [Psychrobacillus sp. INOP01]QUG40085.1 general stress protein [Psychrobacillus sp. INOP01]
MEDKKFVGSFLTEQEVLDKIKELKLEGYVEDDIYVVTNNKESLSIVRGQTAVELESVEGNWLDKFKAFLTGDEPVRAAFSQMGFTDEDSQRYYSEVKNGGILLYVDKNYGTIYDEYAKNQSDSSYDGTDMGYTGESIRAGDVENRLNQYPLSDRGER